VEYLIVAQNFGFFQGEIILVTWSVKTGREPADMSGFTFRFRAGGFSSVGAVVHIDKTTGFSVSGDDNEIVSLQLLHDDTLLEGLVPLNGLVLSWDVRALPADNVFASGTVVVKHSFTREAVLP